MRKREHWHIMGQLMELLDGNAARAEPQSMSRVAQRANLPYDRFTGYVAQLRQTGLVTGDPPRSTPKGQALLAAWQQWQEVLHRFGLD